MPDCPIAETGKLSVIYEPYTVRTLDTTVGIVKISEQMHEKLRYSSSALSRSINSQAEHWLRVGMLAELNPALNYSEICQMLLQSAREEADLETAASLDNVARLA